MATLKGTAGNRAGGNGQGRRSTVTGYRTSRNKCSCSPVGRPVELEKIADLRIGCKVCFGASLYFPLIHFVFLLDGLEDSLDVFVSGFASSSRPPDQASRSQKAFIRLAKGMYCVLFSNSLIYTLTLPQLLHHYQACRPRNPQPSA